MKFRLLTLGCKVNEYESEYYAEQLKALGFEKAREQEAADVCIINTCTVTNTAARKSRQKIHRARRENPRALVAVVGCYAQTMEEEIRQALDADLVVGAVHKKDLAVLIQQALQERNPGAGGEKTSASQPTDGEGASRSYVEDVLHQLDFENMPIGSFEGQQRAFLKIQDGCNQYCAYCQIPLARGFERSAVPEEIVATAKALAEKGHQEIVLTGIHTGRYHFRGLHLSGLLEQLLEQTPEEVCYRLSSIEITEVDDALIALMQNNPRILPHLHIPIQSACNATLARMNRPYTVEEFADRLQQIREAVPQVSVSTDVICGFVQESEEEFAQTRENLEKLGFSFLHVFPYSRRKGTKADSMTGFVQDSVIKARTRELLALSDVLRARDMARFDQVEVLVERQSAPGVWSGYTANYHPALVESSRPLSGRIAGVPCSQEGLQYRIVMNGGEES